MGTEEGGIMKRGPTFAIACALLLGTLVSCTGEPVESRKPKSTLFIGVDASGSFRHRAPFDTSGGAR